MVIDHIVPVSAGGEAVADNLCLTCPGCNLFKLDHQTGYDMESDQETALFNPRIQRWSDHFQWTESGVILIGLTPTGRATIERLRMNRHDVVQSRRLWVEVGWHPPDKREL